MSKLVRTEGSYLKLLAQTTKAQQKALADTITLKQLKALVEISVNLLKGNIILSTKLKVELNKHRKFYRFLANLNIAISAKRKSVCYRHTALALLVQASLETWKK